MQKWFIDKKFNDRFADKNARLVEYADQYAGLVPEVVQKEVEDVVQSSTQRFDVCIASFNDLVNVIGSLNEKLKHHGSVIKDVEKWLRKAEEIIATEPKWKVQVVLNEK